MNDINDLNINNYYFNEFILWNYFHLNENNKDIILNINDIDGYIENNQIDKYILIMHGC